MADRTPYVPDGDPSEPGPAIALTPEAHAQEDHTGIPGVGAAEDIVLRVQVFS